MLRNSSKFLFAAKRDISAISTLPSEIAKMPIDFKSYPTDEAFFDELYRFILDTLEDK